MSLRRVRDSHPHIPRRRRHRDPRRIIRVIHRHSITKSDPVAHLVAHDLPLRYPAQPEQHARPEQVLQNSLCARADEGVA